MLYGKIDRDVLSKVQISFKPAPKAFALEVLIMDSEKSVPWIFPLPCLRVPAIWRLRTPSFDVVSNSPSGNIDT